MKHEQLHQYFIRAVDDVRQRLGLENIGHFSLHLKSSGRTLSDAGECKIEYSLSSESWHGNPVTGADLDKVIDEIIRRQSWDKRNAPLTLPPAREDSL